jgi:hypothetical protein
MMKRVKVCPQFYNCNLDSLCYPDHRGHLPSCLPGCHFFDRCIERLLFTPEETEHIKSSLKNFEESKVVRFIKGLESLCEEEARINRKGERERLLDDKQELLHKTRAYARILKRAGAGKGLLHPKDKIGSDNTDGDRLTQLFKKTWAAFHAVMDLQEALESEQGQGNKGGRGRRRADDDGFVFSIAQLYESVFDVKPTKTKTGTFSDIIEIALEAVELPHKDPSRRLDNL